MTKKNRKARRLQQLHPEVRIRVFYQRDYLSLLMKYGLEPPSQLAGVDGPPLWLAESREPGAPPPEPTVQERPKRRSRSA